MTSLLGGLHLIAARRGDGLRPELLRALASPLAPSPAPSLARCEVPGAAIVEATGGAVRREGMAFGSARVRVEPLKPDGFGT